MLFRSLPEGVFWIYFNTIIPFFVLFHKNSFQKLTALSFIPQNSSFSAWFPPITGQKAVATISRKDIANLKLRKKMPIGVMVSVRRERMYEFLEKLVRVALPRIRDFKGIESKFDGEGNYTLGIQEQIIFPEISIDSITRILGMNITMYSSSASAKNFSARSASYCSSS